VPITYLLVWTKLEDAKHWVYSFMFLVVVLNVAANPKVIINLEKGWLNKLGRFSYGIYMYQYVVIISVMAILKSYFPPDKGNLLLFNFIYYISSTIGVILISHFSYEYFEKRFIKMKSKFASILSGDLVKGKLAN